MSGTPLVNDRPDVLSGPDADLQGVFASDIFNLTVNDACDAGVLARQEGLTCTQNQLSTFAGIIVDLCSMC